MRQVHVIATWQSEHLVELADGDALDDLVEVLQTQSTVTAPNWEAPRRPESLATFGRWQALESRVGRRRNRPSRSPNQKPVPPVICRVALASRYDAARLAPLRRARGDGSFEIADTPAAILCPFSSTTSN